ncbi:hypothetical protein KFE80_02455 [bacterium SCSIO 12696]|nr:hypothetical protein KFE80_02455 [bacterium SCSIO 12696]
MIQPKLEKQLQDALRESEHTMPDDLQEQIAGARQAALDSQAEPQPMLTWSGFAIAMATVIVVAMLFAPMFNYNNTALENSVAALENDLEQNLDFYQWLLETDAIEGIDE